MSKPRLARMFAGAVALLLVVSLPSAETPRDLAGHPLDPLASAPPGTVVLLFVATDCPISNRYAPVVNALTTRYRSPTVRFFLVYPDRSVLPAAIIRHLAEYSYDAPALLDPAHELVRRAGVTVTPEVAVFSVGPEGSSTARLLYRGRIDDRHSALGRSRPEPDQQDLRDVLAALAKGESPAPRTTRAIGCYIE